MKSPLGMLLLLLALSVDLSSAILPIKCRHGSSRCTLESYQGVYYDRAPCKALSVVYPTNEVELIAAVASGVKKRHKMRVVSKLSHSLTKLACPDGGLLISTSKYDSKISINKDKMTVTADAGVQLQDLLAKLAEEGLALPCTPYFNGLSISGVISTGSHGSSLLGRGSAVHDYVSGISIVVPASKSKGYAKLVKLTKADPDLNAAKLSIGVLGAISKVTLDVEPMFKRSITKLARNDTTLEDEVISFGNESSFGDMSWYPFQKKVLVRLDNKVPVTTPGNGRQAGNDPEVSSKITQSRTEEEKMMAQYNRSLLCARSLNGVENRVLSGDGLINEASIKNFTGYPVVGFNHEMETQGSCQNTALNNTRTSTGDLLTCWWDKDVRGQFYYQASIAIPLSKMKEVILDIKTIRDRHQEKLCAWEQYGGAQLRYVKGSSAYLAEPFDAVVLDMLYYREHKKNKPRLDQDVTDEIEQMLLTKYKGRPHWGKNKEYAFEDISSRVGNLAKFLEVKQRYDPRGYFSSKWTDAVLGIRKKGVSIVRDYCALEGLCVCSKDSHCAPRDGYFCEPGLVFNDTRVCRKRST